MSVRGIGFKGVYADFLDGILRRAIGQLFAEAGVRYAVEEQFIRAARRTGDAEARYRTVIKRAHRPRFVGASHTHGEAGEHQWRTAVGGHVFHFLRGDDLTHAGVGGLDHWRIRRDHHALGGVANLQPYIDHGMLADAERETFAAVGLEALHFGDDFVDAGREEGDGILAGLGRNGFVPVAVFLFDGGDLDARHCCAESIGNYPAESAAELLGI